jgi:hypothetical protein
MTPSGGHGPQRLHGRPHLVAPEIKVRRPPTPHRLIEHLLGVDPQQVLAARATEIHDSTGVRRYADADVTVVQRDLIGEGQQRRGSPLDGGFAC